MNSRPSEHKRPLNEIASHAHWGPELIKPGSQPRGTVEVPRCRVLSMTPPVKPRSPNAVHRYGNLALFEKEPRMPRHHPVELRHHLCERMLACEPLKDLARINWPLDRRAAQMEAPGTHRRGSSPWCVEPRGRPFATGSLAHQGARGRIESGQARDSTLWRSGTPDPKEDSR